MVVADLFFAASSANAVGVPTGVNGILVVDIDQHPGQASGFDTIGELGLEVPATFQQASVSGTGVHLVYAAPSEPVTTGNVLPGIDSKGGSSWVVWGDAVPGEWSFPPAPEWGIKRPAAKAEAGVSMSVGDWMEKNPGEPVGGLLAALDALPAHGSPEWANDKLLPLAIRLVNEAWLSTGGAAARDIFIARYASGEWADDAHRADAARAFDRAIEGYGLASMASIDAPIFVGGEQVYPPKVEPIAQVIERKPRSLSALMDVEFPALDWVVPGIIPEGTTLLVAPAKAGKSWLALDVALASATGSKAFGSVEIGEPRPVLYVDLESGERRLQARVRAQDWREFGAFEYLLERDGAAERIEAFFAEHRGQRPLVILDTLVGLMEDKPKDRSPYKHEYETLSRYQRLTKADAGAAMLIAHHTRKMQTNDPMESISGTNGIAGAVDTPIVLGRPDRNSTAGTLNVMARDFEGGEFAIDFRDCRWHLEGGDVDAAIRMHEQREHERQRDRIGPVGQVLLQIIESDAAREWGIADIEALYGGEASRVTITRTLARLADGGHINRSRRGAYRAA